MNKHDDGGQAFPVQNGYEASTVQGMSLRDYFAAKAMQGLISAAYKSVSEAYSDKTDQINPIFAMSAYEMADAMLKERSK